MLDGERLASMTRANAAGVTPEWAEWWPLMRMRLLRFLRSRGVAAHAAEDAVQDVAERLLTREVPHTDVDDLMRWCMTVARNAAIDQHRRLRRSVPLDSCDEDAVDGPDLHELVEARMRLDRVLRALGNMSYDDVRCVVASLDDATAEVASPALRARRHRLRRRLSEMVGCFGLFGAVMRALRPRAGRTTLGLSSAAVASVALVTVVAGPVHVGSSPEQVPLRIAPVTARVEPVGTGADAVLRGVQSTAAARRGAKTARPPARQTATGIHLRSPDKGGMVDVRTHDREPDDKGIVCIGGLYYVDDRCVDLPHGLGGSGPQ